MTMSSVRRPAWSLVAVLAVLLWLSLCAPGWWNPAGWRRAPGNGVGVPASRPVQTMARAPQAPAGALVATLVPVESDPPILVVDALSPRLSEAIAVEVEEDPFAASALHGPSLPSAAAAPPPPSAPPLGVADAPPANEAWGDADFATAYSEPEGGLIPRPLALLADLEALMLECDAHPWALATWQESNALAKEKDAGLATKSLERLRAFAQQPLTADLSQRSATRVRRAQWALERRLDIWQAVLLAELEQERSPDRQPALAMAQAVRRVDTLLAPSPNGQGWQHYFGLESLMALANSPRTSADEIGRATRSLLARSRNPRLDERQRRFLNSEPWAALRRAARTWAGEQFSPGALLTAIERYEQTGAAADARLVAEQSRRLFWSRDPHLRRLGEKLEQRFRNANLRMVVQADLANRLLPPQPVTEAPVYDTVLGVPTRGSSTTATEVSVRFVPDATQIRTLFEIQGWVDAATRSTSGPASFRSRAQSDFLASKPVLLGPAGLSFAPSQVSVDTQLRLLSLDTDFDGVPLIGALVRNMAASEHEESQPRARAEIRRKIAARSMQQIDEQTEERLTGLSDRARARVWAPLTGLGLTPRPVQLATETERALARLRLADAGQLAAHTPRPQAPANSLASVQVHESAFNNVFEKLALDGREFTLPELQQYLAERLKLPEWKPAAADEDVWLQFAAHDPVRVRFNEGVVEIRIAFAEFVRGDNRWQDFTALVRYRPAAHGLRADLARDGIVELISPELNSRDRIQLQVIFNKVFTRSKPLAVLGERLAEDPRLAGLEATQFLAEEGWLGLALGSARRPAPNVARQNGPRTVR